MPSNKGNKKSKKNLANRLFRRWSLDSKSTNTATDQATSNGPPNGTINSSTPEQQLKEMLQHGNLPAMSLAAQLAAEGRSNNINNNTTAASSERALMRRASEPSVGNNTNASRRNVNVTQQYSQKPLPEQSLSTLSVSAPSSSRKLLVDNNGFNYSNKEKILTKTKKALNDQSSRKEDLKGQPTDKNKDKSHEDHTTASTESTSISGLSNKKEKRSDPTTTRMETSIAEKVTSSAATTQPRHLSPTTATTTDITNNSYRDDQSSTSTPTNSSLEKKIFTNIQKSPIHNKQERDLVRTRALLSQESNSYKRRPNRKVDPSLRISNHEQDFFKPTPDMFGDFGNASGELESGHDRGGGNKQVVSEDRLWASMFQITDDDDDEANKSPFSSKGHMSLRTVDEALPPFSRTTSPGAVRKDQKKSESIFSKSDLLEYPDFPDMNEIQDFPNVPAFETKKDDSVGQREKTNNVCNVTNEKTQIGDAAKSDKAKTKKSRRSSGKETVNMTHEEQILAAMAEMNAKGSNMYEGGGDDDDDDNDDDDNDDKGLGVDFEESFNNDDDGMYLASEEIGNREGFDVYGAERNYSSESLISYRPRQFTEIEWLPPTFAVAETDEAGSTRSQARRSSLPASWKETPYEPVTPKFPPAHQNKQVVPSKGFGSSLLSSKIDLLTSEDDDSDDFDDDDFFVSKAVEGKRRDLERTELSTKGKGRSLTPPKQQKGREARHHSMNMAGTVTPPKRQKGREARHHSMNMAGTDASVDSRVLLSRNALLELGVRSTSEPGFSGSKDTKNVPGGKSKRRLSTSIVEMSSVAKPVSGKKGHKSNHKVGSRELERNNRGAAPLSPKLSPKLRKNMHGSKSPKRRNIEKGLYPASSKVVLKSSRDKERNKSPIRQNEASGQNNYEPPSPTRRSRNGHSRLDSRKDEKSHGSMPETSSSNRHASDSDEKSKRRKSLSPNPMGKKRGSKKTRRRETVAIGDSSRSLKSDTKSSKKKKASNESKAGRQRRKSLPPTGRSAPSPDPPLPGKHRQKASRRPSAPASSGHAHLVSPRSPKRSTKGNSSNRSSKTSGSQLATKKSAKPRSHSAAKRRPSSGSGSTAESPLLSYMMASSGNKPSHYSSSAMTFSSTATPHSDGVLYHDLKQKRKDTQRKKVRRSSLSDLETSRSRRPSSPRPKKPSASRDRDKAAKVSKDHRSKSKHASTLNMSNRQKSRGDVDTQNQR